MPRVITAHAPCHQELATVYANVRNMSMAAEAEEDGSGRLIFRYEVITGASIAVREIGAADASPRV